MTTELRGVGVSILLAYDGWPVVGPGPHFRCVAANKPNEVWVQAVNFPDKAVDTLKRVRDTTVRDSDLVGDLRLGYLYDLYPTLVVRRRAS